MRTSAPVSVFQIFANLSIDPLTKCFPSGEKATDHTPPEWPDTVHSGLQTSCSTPSSSSSMVQMHVPVHVWPIVRTCQ